MYFLKCRNFTSSLDPYLPIFLRVYTRHLFTSTKSRGLTRMLKSLIDNLHVKRIFDLRKKKKIPVIMKIMKLVKLQNLVAKCCKMQKI
jgi:hypothetical protein